MSEIANYEFKTLNLPRGKAGLPALSIDMTEVYRAEGRLREVAVANDGTSLELASYFNEVCNLTSKYISWIDYEIVEAKKEFDKAKAVVVLDKMLDEFKKFKDAGIKNNEDFREALIVRDPECARAQDTVDMLNAAKKLLEGKFWSFLRAYNTTNSVAERRRATPIPNLNGNPNGTSPSWMPPTFGPTDLTRNR